MAAKLSGKDRSFSSVLLTIIKAAVAGVAISTLLLLLFSFILSKKDLPLEIINPFTAILIALSSFSSGYIAAKLIKQRGMAVGAACGTIIFLFITLLSFMNSADIGVLTVIKLAVSVISGAIGGILGVNTKRKRK